MKTPPKLYDWENATRWQMFENLEDRRDVLVHNCWSHRGVLPDLMRNILQKNVQGVQFTNVGFKQPPKGGTWRWQCSCCCIIVHVLTAQEKDYQELEEEGGDADDGEHEEVGDQEGAASVLQRERK